MTFIFSFDVLGKDNYSIEDLKVLFSQKSYEEYMLHHLDVRPTLRDAQWKKMTLEMCALYIKSATEKKDINTASFDTILKFLSTPSLNSDHYSQFLFSKFALSYFKQCAENKAECKNKIQEYWAGSKRFVEIDQQLFVYAKIISKDVADKLLISILNDSSSKLYCSKEENFNHIKQLLLSKIESEDSVDQTFKKTNHILDNNCRNALLSKIKQETIETKNNGEREKFLKYLKAFQLSDEKFEASAYTLYLLNGPYIGDVFNLAWNRLAIMSQNHILRESVLSRIMRLEVMPDAIVNLNDQKRSDIIISYINRNFPEYFEVYTKTCIAYYSGSKTFPKGNPTLYCDKFIERSKKLNWVSEALIKNYTKAKKI